VVLGVTGGIAAYKAVQLARDLTQLGALVDVALTRAAGAFVGAITFEAVTGRPVRTDILAPGFALDHIRLGRDADLVCIAPATADTIARAAAGAASDLITAILLATEAPVLFCPAMNDRMYAHAGVQRNLERLRELGYGVVGPAVGPLAFGEGQGPGRLEEPDAIVQHIGRALEGTTPLSGRRVLVSAGPTREAIDPVRFLSNRSSGRMGYALAQAAWRRGADVTLVSGPTALEPPVGPALVRVETAEEMTDAVTRELPGRDVLVMAAAVADFRPARVAPEKMKKGSRPDAIALEPAPDVLRATRAARPAGMVAVGFALETENARANARTKLESKDLDLIVLNDATVPGAGFEVETNQVVLLDRAGGAQELPLLSKDEVADAILDRVVSLLQVR
jgi:phosphopantothenoylcysteine decarboxylase/phosphopantothenate--cysteine ligase